MKWIYTVEFSQVLIILNRVQLTILWKYYNLLIQYIWWTFNAVDNWEGSSVGYYE